MGRNHRGNGESSPPIPTYSESTAQTPTSATAFLGPSEISHDAERQGLLGQASNNSNQRFNGYQPPTVESARSSMDFSLSSGQSSARHSEDNLRQEIEQMEMEEPDSGSTTWKRISGFTSSMHLPFRQWLPSLRWARGLIPALPEGFKFNPILLIRVFALLLVLGLLYILFFSGLVRLRQKSSVTFVEEDLRRHFQAAINETRIQENLKHLTQWDHVAGTKGNFYLAKWIESQMIESGLESVAMEEFQVYLNYPKKDGRRVAIISPPEKQWQAKLEEDRAYPNREQTLVFHGLSKSGNVTGPLVYANYGAKEDFKMLKDAGVSVNGSIALVRYGGSQGDRALKVKNAELAGAVGCIIYSDPKENGFDKEITGFQRYRTSDSVERGSVALTGFVAGDVLSPGFASLPTEGHRIKKEESAALNKIPSIPIAWRDAKPLLQALKGHGKHLEGNSLWQGGIPDVEWWTGDQGSPIVNLQNDQDEVERQPIYNVLGKIEGSEQTDRSIIIGNHYDSWCFGGADPGSGTAVMLELVQAFGYLLKYGWRPRRTIEFIAWDAEEYNLIGSTEHVEAHIEELKRNAYAYINIDVAATGPNLNIDASPVFSTAVVNVLKRVTDPDTDKNMYKLWREKNKRIGELGAGSDYLAFQDFAGVSSIDLSFEGAPYPYHSCYENFDWMARYGDPDFQYHKLMGEIVALLALELSDEPLLQFDLSAYAGAMEGYTKRLENHVANLTRNDLDAKDKKLDFTKLHEATKLLETNAKKLKKYSDEWVWTFINTGVHEGMTDTITRWAYNDKLAAFETHLLDIDGGLPTRPQYKHVIFAPDKWSGYDGSTFPGPRDALEVGDWKLAQQQLDLAANIIHDASQLLLD